MVRSLLVGLLLIVCLSLVVASAGSLEVDGGTIQVFEYTVEVPGVKGGTSLEAYKTAAGFGMFGTPSAVLVNDEGKIISETAVGAANIWSLVGKK